ncbi:MAG: hypothetical protein PVI57_20560 [Gemmatimonadota bacterium]|jgi:hypothetical protein
MRGPDPDREADGPGEEVPAPVWAKLVLAALPFLVVLVVLLVLRSLRG